MFFLFFCCLSIFNKIIISTLCCVQVQWVKSIFHLPPVCTRGRYILTINTFKRLTAAFHSLAFPPCSLPPSFYIFIFAETHFRLHVGWVRWFISYHRGVGICKFNHKSITNRSVRALNKLLSMFHTASCWCCWRARWELDACRHKNDGCCRGNSK